MTENLNNNNNNNNNNKNILIGGKLIGQGTYGCVFRPMIPCKGSNKRESGKVSKFLVKSEAEKELKETQVLDKIDKDYIFHFKTPKLCDFNLKYKKEPGINDCMPFKNASSDFKRMKLLQMTDGGMELHIFLQNVKLNSIDQKYKLLLGLEPLFIGLKQMYLNKFSHFDIKTLNTVINPESYQMKYIDFGLSKYNNEHMKYITNYRNIYFAYPYELQLLYYYEEFKNNPLFEKINVLKEEIKFRIKYKYNSNYSRTLDSTYVKNGSIYLSSLTNKFMTNFFENIRNNKGSFLKEIVSKVDVFSLGIVCIYIFKKVTNQKFSVNTKNKDLNKVYDAFYKLIKRMIDPSSKTRINGIEACDFFQTKVMPLINSNKKPVIKPVKPVIKPVKPDMKRKDYCPPNKIINPKTKRCVLRTGKIGKQLIEKENMKKKVVKKPVVKKTVNCKGKNKIVCEKNKKCKYINGQKRQYCRKK